MEPLDHFDVREGKPMTPVTIILIVLLIVGTVLWLTNKGLAVLFVGILLTLVALLLGYA